MKFVKNYWLPIVLILGLLTTVYIILEKNKEIESLYYQLADLESGASELENANNDLQTQLEECQENCDNSSDNEEQTSIGSTYRQVNPVQDAALQDAAIQDASAEVDGQ